MDTSGKQADMAQRRGRLAELVINKREVKVHLGLHLGQGVGISEVVRKLGVLEKEIAQLKKLAVDFLLGEVMLPEVASVL